MVKKATIKKAVIVPEIKKGVKAGTKRGAYKKKNSITIEDLQQNEIAVNELKKDLLNDNTNINNNRVITETPEIPETINESEADIHELKYEQFLKDSNDFNPDDFKEVEFTAPTENKNESETSNKEFDFTNTTNTENSNPLNNLKNEQKAIINGMLLLSICDFVVPNLIKFISKYIDSNAKFVDVSKTKLDSEQKASLKEVADFASAYIFEKINPMLLFFIGMGSMYYANFNSELETVKSKRKHINEMNSSELKKQILKK